MKATGLPRLVSFVRTTGLFVVLSTALAPAIRAAELPSGHWEGAIELPGTQLAVRVDLEKGETGEWSGAIDIPVQALRGFKLADVTVKDAEVAFVMPGIPGNPSFQGKIDADGKTLCGLFTQATVRVPFKLERKDRMEGPNQTPAKGIPGQGLAGHWQGSLRVQIIELRLVLHLSRGNDGGWEGAMDSIDQGANGIPVTAIEETGPKVHLELQSIGGTYDGEMSADGSEVAGEWRQGGQTFPLVFKRLAQAPDTSRPQDPKAPLPYEVEEVLFENPAASIKLAGTLTRPRGPGPHPAVVLISGSGPQDRNEAIMGHRPFLVLADHLTRHGIAVLRYDDRGVGGSTGEFGTATHDDFTEDALAAVAFLKTRREISSQRIGLIGHSEGGIVAPAAAVRSEDVAFIVLMAGVGVPMEELLDRQGRDILRVLGVGEDLIEKNSLLQRDIFRKVKAETDPAVLEGMLRELARKQVAELTEEQRKALGVSDSMIEGQIKMLLGPWFRHLLAYDPRPTLRRVHCPVLAINGEKDVQVAAQENLGAIQAALAEGGNGDFQTVELAGLNHLFQGCQTGAVAEYAAIEETIAPSALALISDWIRARAGL